MTRYLSLLLLLMVSLPTLAVTKDVKAAKALAQRMMPQVANQISFEQLQKEGSNDVFELESVNGLIVIRGNSANSMAVGLNHYLKYYCKTSVSWYLNDPVELPQVLPTVARKERITSRMEKRFFLNYCTFGYSMPWWQWEDWERLIDWMALNGINMPLAITGQESVWYKVWRKLGLTDQEIRSYFTGPTYLAWHRMSNIDYWLGSLPHSWLNHQEELQKKIVERERSLNMTPVLPAFAGHVPKEIARIFPDAKITKMTSWGGFREAYNSQFLDPLDPLFAKIQKAFLKEQERLYGTDHIYGADPFNEIDSPSWEPEYLATVSRTIYDTMKQCDPQATWLQMTWLFYFDRGHWTNPRINAFVNAVPKNKMILLDYFAEKTEVWKQTESYFGQPYLWCYLGNFGGNTMLKGNIREVGNRIENTYTHGGANFWGIGSTLEEFGVNPQMYEYVFEKAWNKSITDDEWMDAWADSRVGETNPAMRQVWRTLSDKVYNSNAELGQGTLTNSRPCLESSGTWTVRPETSYDDQELFRAWESMLNHCNSQRTAYMYDVVNIGRQVLSDHFKLVRDQFTVAYKQKNKQALLEQGQVMISILNDLDLLLSSHSSFLFGKWIQDASQFGINKDEIAYYRKNARCLLTTWGEKGTSLNDYANRSWSGLTNGYYRARWEMFINDVYVAVEQGTEFDQKQFNQKMIDWEQDFVDNDFISADIARKDGVKTAKRLMEKYKKQILRKN